MSESVKPFSKLYDLTQRAEKVGISDDDVLREILVEKIVPNKYQPRREFTEDKIKELAESIKQNGLLQSITVRDIGNGFYELIAGERRLRAIKYLQYPTTKAIVKELTEEQMATLALIENIQREELTPIEEAHAYQELLSINKLTQDELAKSLGKTQATVANKLRLLKLSDKVIDAINTKKITERHGRAMVKLDASAQEKLLIQILSQNLNVSQTEEKLATEVGYWPILRFDPRLAEKGKNPLQLDSKSPAWDKYEEFLKRERRYTTLLAEFPDHAKVLFEMNLKNAKDTWNFYKRMAAMDYSTEE